LLKKEKPKGLFHSPSFWAQKRVPDSLTSSKRRGFCPSFFLTHLRGSARNCVLEYTTKAGSMRGYSFIPLLFHTLDVPNHRDVGRGQTLRTNKFSSNIPILKLLDFPKHQESERGPHLHRTRRDPLICVLQTPLL